MKHYSKYWPVFLLLILTLNARAQRFYSTNAGEIIFSGADVVFNDVSVNTNLRFTMFFHWQHNWHFDLTNNIGVFSGFAIRNIGFITEDLYQNMGFIGVDNTHANFNKSTKIKRRSYSLGIPVALKLGMFDKHVYLYGGGEYEWMFHYKQKMFLDGNKVKYKEWTSDRVNSWIPSFFVGIQFPKGVNLKFKYYLDNFLNPNFRGSDFGQPVDYSQFGKTQIWYISLCFQFSTKDLMNSVPVQDRTAYRY